MALALEWRHTGWYTRRHHSGRHHSGRHRLLLRCVARFPRDEVDVTIRVYRAVQGRNRVAPSVVHVEFLLVTPQASNLIFFFVGVQCQLPIVDAHFLQETGNRTSVYTF